MRNKEIFGGNMEEFSVETESNEQNKKTSKNYWWLVVVLVISVILIVSGVVGLTGRNEELTVSGLEMKVDYNEYWGYSATITGVAKNVTSEDFSYASVEFSVYDSAGNNLGTALANINNLQAGDTWRFEATLLGRPSSRPVSYKLVEIIAW